MGNGWIRCVAGSGSHEVSYLPEGEGGVEQAPAQTGLTDGGQSARGRSKAKAKAKAKTRARSGDRSGSRPRPSGPVSHARRSSTPPPLRREKSDEMKTRVHRIVGEDACRVS